MGWALGVEPKRIESLLKHLVFSCGWTVTSEPQTTEGLFGALVSSFSCGYWQTLVASHVGFSMRLCWAGCLASHRTRDPRESKREQPRQATSFLSVLASRHFCILLVRIQFYTNRLKTGLMYWPLCFFSSSSVQTVAISLPAQNQFFTQPIALNIDQISMYLAI